MTTWAELDAWLSSIYPRTHRCVVCGREWTPMPGSITGWRDSKDGSMHHDRDTHVPDGAWLYEDGAVAAACDHHKAEKVAAASAFIRPWLKQDGPERASDLQQ